MKVVYVITRADVMGGAQIHVRDLSEALIAAGHEVCVITGKRGVLNHQLTLRKAPNRALAELTRPIHPLNDVRALWKIYTALKELSPDVVSTHSSKAGWLGRIAARVLRLPVIFTAHGWAFSEGTPGLTQCVYALLERLAAPFADRIITVSEFDRRLALRRRVAPGAKLITIHNGVHDLAGAPASAARTANPVRVLMVARYEKQKDHRTLFQALSRNSDLDWRLDLIGEGRFEARTRALAVELGLGERISFHGPRDDVGDFMAKVHIYALMSNWEGFPRSILEAMRAALPVIASDVGGTSEAVIDGVNGFLVPRNDVKVLANRLQTLIQDPALRQRMGRKGRADFEEKFEFGVMFDRTLEVYRTVAR
ncbi:MAG: glycosyltransferase family 4 protein [Proteobacteria bacterium]|nr:glycosyltransferase family 4 protein [Pseudomonadota bacterium]